MGVKLALRILCKTHGKLIWTTAILGQNLQNLIQIFCHWRKKYLKTFQTLLVVPFSFFSGSKKLKNEVLNSNSNIKEDRYPPIRFMLRYVTSICLECFAFEKCDLYSDVMRGYRFALMLEFEFKTSFLSFLKREKNA